jgi:steroid 5-alpha reductase family enzyme
MWLTAWWLIEMGTADLILYDWLMISMVFFWGLRLTWNWWSGWKGMDHQDWRYTDLKEKTGAMYPFVSLTGIHLFPTILVFLGCVPVYYIIKNQAIAHEWSHLQNIFYIAFIFIAIVLEAIADHQRRHKVNHRGGQVYRSGVWALSRHPNYLGEICFWGGLYMYAMGQHFELYWTGIGTLAMILLFVFISIPMMEKRQIKNKPDYKNYQKSVSMLLPWPPK